MWSKIARSTSVIEPLPEARSLWHWYTTKIPKQSNCSARNCHRWLMDLIWRFFKSVIASQNRKLHKSSIGIYWHNQSLLQRRKGFHLHLRIRLEKSNQKSDWVFKHLQGTLSNFSTTKRVILSPLDSALKIEINIFELHQISHSSKKLVTCFRIMIMRSVMISSCQRPRSNFRYSLNLGKDQSKTSLR